MLKSRLWVTEDTLVRTCSGWEKAKDCYKFKQLIGYNDETKSYIGVSVKEYNKFKYQGIISKEDNNIVNAKIYSYEDTGKPSKLEYYDGYLFNVITENNTIITSLEEGDKYSILKCQTK